MTFNPVTWNSTQPITTQNISTGQSTIKNNFDFFSNASGNGAGNSTKGFFQCPNGLIFQWGMTGGLTVGNSTYIFNGTTAANSVNIQPFPTYCYAIFIQPISTSPNGKVPPCIGTSGTSLQKDRVEIYIATGSSYTGGAYVFAIGI